MDNEVSIPIGVKWPSQKKSIKAKDKKWRKQHLDWADKNTKLYNRSARKSYIQKKINIDLLSGKVYLAEIKRFLNPFEKQNIYLPNQIPHYPLINNIVDVLIGEESNRKFKLNCRAINQDAISTVEEKKTELARQLLLQYIQQEFPDQVAAQQEAQRIQNYMKYSVVDLEELQDNWILQHYMRECDFETKMLKGFRDKLSVAESIYYFDVYNNEPSMEVLRPEMVTTYRTSGSNKIEDSDIIIIDDYWSPGKIQDLFYEELTTADIAYLDEVSNSFEGGGTGQWTDATQNDQYISIEDINQGGNIIPQETLEGYLSFAYNEGLTQGNYVDADGNIRVLRVVWKSKRKVLKVKSYDPTTGEEVYNFRSEDYKIRKDLGEEVTELWPGEWWEGTKIGQKVYLRMRPKPTQARLNRISSGFSGFVGTVMTSNRRKPYSLVDRAKPYNYMYDVIFDRLMKLIANNIGEVLEVDTAKIPSKWTPETWMTILRNENIAFVDSFKEGNKGASTGKLAGNMNTTGKSMSLDLSSSIQLYMQMLQWITTTMSSMVGITPQRLGEITNRETVGGVERSVTQSSHITAEFFASQDNDKIRCAEALLECAKIALRGRNKKIQFVTDDGVNHILDIVGDDFYSKDHSIFIENELDQNGLRQELKQVAQAWSQNETVLPSTILKIMTDPSLTSIQRKIESDIEAKQTREQQTQQQQIQSQEQMLQQQLEAQQRTQEIEKLKLEFDQFIKKYEIDQNNMTKMQVAMLNSEEVDDDKVEKDYELKSKQIEETIRHNQATEQIQSKKLK